VLSEGEIFSWREKPFVSLFGGGGGVQLRGGEEKKGNISYFLAKKRSQSLHQSLVLRKGGQGL